MSLRMEFGEVRTKGQMIANRSQDVLELKQWLGNVVNGELPAMWQGSGYQGFAERYAELAPTFDKIAQLISDIGNGVVQNAQAYESFDQQVGSSNRG